MALLAGKIVFLRQLATLHVLSKHVHVHIDRVKLISSSLKKSHSLKIKGPGKSDETISVKGSLKYKE